jgi:hypothetical protein
MVAPAMPMLAIGFFVGLVYAAIGHYLKTKAIAKALDEDGYTKIGDHWYTGNRHCSCTDCILSGEWDKARKRNQEGTSN